jgi:ADP-ribosyl-[dinitrogen reductase] hydrolase
MRRFAAWMNGGAYSCTGTCFDIGNITRQALRHFQQTGDPFAGSEAPDTAGNGSLMRVAPVALRTLEDNALALRIARDQSRTAHAAAEAVEACDLFVQILRDAIKGGGKDALCPQAWNGAPKVQAIAAGVWRGKPRVQIRSTGYVIDTLEAALWCADQAASFEEALVLAVNLAGDADTVGAVTGQVAGAVFGASAIPRRWLEPLAWRSRLESSPRDSSIPLAPHKDPLRRRRPSALPPAPKVGLWDAYRPKSDAGTRNDGLLPSLLIPTEGPLIGDPIDPE